MITGSRVASRPRQQSLSVFFYGSYMDPANRPIPRPAGTRFEIGRLPGHRLLVDPIARIVRSEGSSVYGTIERITAEQLRALYGSWPMSRYRMSEVQVERSNGTIIDAVTYSSGTPVLWKADPQYGERLLAIAREVGLPSAYLDEVARLTAPSLRL